MASAGAIAAAVAFLAQSGSAATSVFSENFEDATGAYTTSIPEFNGGFDDHFGRTDGSNIHLLDADNEAYEGFDGSFFFAAEDADHEGGTLPAHLTTNAFSVLGFPEVRFTGLFAAGNSGGLDPRYESDDYVRVYIDFDGADTFATQLLGFETPLEVGSNQNILEDTDLDGRGDGTILDDIMRTFSRTIANPGASIAQIRISIETGATNEEFGFDALMVEGIPEPSIPAMLGLGIGGLFLRRRVRRATSRTVS